MSIESERKESMTEEKHPLELALLTEQIRAEKAKARVAELELEKALDAERDRTVKLGKIRHLSINDIIGGRNTDSWLDALQHWERRDPGQDVTIDIFSPGGEITHGLAIFDQIQRMRRKGSFVTTRGSGLVASMAAVLLQAGDRRILDRRAKLLIHEGSGGFSGTVGEMEDYKQFSDMLRNDILDIMAERSTLTRRQIQSRWKRKDWWLSSADALKYGFCDEVE